LVNIVEEPLLTNKHSLRTQLTELRTRNMSIPVNVFLLLTMKLNSCFFIWIACILFAWKAEAQNLVPNGGFELNARCPNSLGDFTATSWFSNSIILPDYFSSCAPAYPGSNVSVPQNIKGFEPAHSGNAYAGIPMFRLLEPFVASPDRTFLKVKLDSPLVYGKWYKFEMFLSVPDSVGMMADIHASVSQTIAHDSFFPDLILQTIIYDTGWTSYKGWFQSEGGEEYLTIGNIYDIQPLMWRQPYSAINNFTGYYYIDDVSLASCTTDVELTLLPDTVYICNVYEGVELSAKDYRVSKYTWSTGSNASSIHVTQPGIYTVTIDGLDLVYCSIIDTVVVLPAPTYTAWLGNDKELCPNTLITLSTPQVASLSYLWSTGDTGNSITVDTSGIYWLKATSANNCKSIDTVKITESPLRSLDLGNNQAVCAPLYLVLNADVPALSYEWNTNETGPYITVERPGMYTVSAKDSFCTVSDSIVISVKPDPVILLGNDTVVCNPAILVLKAKDSSAKYLWNTGDSTQSIIVNKTSTYSVRVDLDGCMALDTIKVSFENTPTIELGNDTIVCQGDTLRLRALTPGSTYQWNTGSTASSILTNTPGKYWVELKKGACKIKDSITVYHQPKPLLDLGPDSSICESQQLLQLQAPMADTYLWQDGSAGSSFTVNAAGLFWVEISKIACKVRDSIIVSSNPLPVVNLGNDQTLCREQTLVLDAGNAGSLFVWNDQSTGQTKQTIPPGIYTVTVTTPKGCTGNDSIRLDTFVSPVINLGRDSFVCEGSVLLLDAGNQYSSYRWQDGTNGHLYEATQPGVYIVNVKDQNHCSVSDSIILTLKPKPRINLANTMKVCEPDFRLRIPGTYIAYQWQDGSTDSTYHISDYGQYQVTVTDQNYCINTAIVEIKNNCPGIVYVPNAFTPLNTDGINDTFYPVVKNIKSLHFQVYNRWGQILFETTKINEGWNGAPLNVFSPLDVFIYKIIYIGMDDQTGFISGNFTLLK
jgi:gliding motility-associated-like protein